MRILPAKYSPSTLGYVIKNLVDKTTGVLAGPNSRLNIYAYINFGFAGSIIYSFFCGLLLNILRKQFFNSSPNISYDKKLLLLLIYLSAIKLENDTPYFISNINNIIFFFSGIIIMNMILKKMHDRKNLIGAV
jgi:hypothetical protein